MTKTGSRAAGLVYFGLLICVALVLGVSLWVYCMSIDVLADLVAVALGIREVHAAKLASTPVGWSLK